MWAIVEQWREPAHAAQRGWVQQKRPHQLTVLIAAVLALSQLCKHWTVLPPPSTSNFLSAKLHTNLQKLRRPICSTKFNRH